MRTRPALPAAAPARDPSGELIAPFEPPSKTRRKAASHGLQELGAALLEMSDAHLGSLGLAEPLFDAIRAHRKIRSHEARRRQMQLIGKLMRSADVEPIRHAVGEMQLGRARDSLALHRAESWRAELIADDAVTTRFASEHPGVDVQQLRALVRSARKDQSLVAEQRSGRAYRELFQFIREHEHEPDA
ncbi:MAG: ribosome biogenesis factor YjgA [Caldimonas sp.]